MPQPEQPSSYTPPEAPPATRRGRVPFRRSALLLGLGVAVGLLVGLGVGGGEPWPIDWSRADGARDNPFPTGTTAVLEHYEVLLGDPREAWEEIQERNAYNDPPPGGREYYIVPVTVRFDGDDEGHPWYDLRVEFVTGRSYTDGCGLIPNDLMNPAGRRPLAPRDTAHGNVCISVPTGAEGVWSVQEGDGDPVYFVARGRE